jgi:hypothetical protein
MPRKTKSKNLKPVPHYRWEQNCPEEDVVATCDGRFKTPEAALQDCQKALEIHGRPGRYDILIGEECDLPVDPEDPRVALMVKSYAEYIIDDIDRESDDFCIAERTCGVAGKAAYQHAAACEALAEQLRPWFRAHVGDAWHRLDRNMAQHYVVVVPAKTEAYPTVATALDQCLKGKLPPDVRRLLRLARQKLHETT